MSASPDPIDAASGSCGANLKVSTSASKRNYVTHFPTPAGGV